MNSKAAMKPAPKRIVIWGGGGHGHVVADLLQAIGGWKLEGYLDNLHPPGASIMGFPVLGDADLFPLREKSEGPPGTPRLRGWLLSRPQPVRDRD